MAIRLLGLGEKIIQNKIRKRKILRAKTNKLLGLCFQISPKLEWLMATHTKSCLVRGYITGHRIQMIKINTKEKIVGVANG